MEHLKNNAISAGIHYIPNHQQPLFKPFYRRLPVTESIFGQILTLPLYFDMQDSDLFKVVEAVKNFSDIDMSKRIKILFVSFGTKFRQLGIRVYQIFAFPEKLWFDYYVFHYF